MDIENLTDGDLEAFLNCEDKVVLLKDIKVGQASDKFSLGFRVFDEALNKGVKEGDLIIISGRSGEGKTTFAQTLTYNFCKTGVPCLWFSYEVSLRELNRKFEEMEIKDFYEVAVPEKNTTGEIEWVSAKIKEGWARYATKIVFIDHIDYLVPKNCRSSDNEQQNLKRIATELKELAINLKIVIITMAHVKKIDNKKEPELYDIGYSAGIFQLADLVFMVSREKIPRRAINENEGDLFTQNSIVKIVKNRETGILKFIKLRYTNGKLLETDNTKRDFNDRQFGQD